MENPKIGRKYSRIVGSIEKCFYISHKDILSTAEIEDWLKTNTKTGLSKRRITSLLMRRPQFIKHKSFRLKGTNSHIHFYSLGPTNEKVEIEARWIEQSESIRNMRVHSSNLVKQCPFPQCGHWNHINTGTFLCINCKNKMDKLWMDFQKLLEKY